MRSHVAIGVAGFLALTAVLSAHDRITTKITWNGEVSRIVQARCVSCHSEGGRAPMPLATYEQARPWAKAIRDEVLARRMPKWHAARGYGDFANDPSLSPFEIALIAAWADGGAPRGTAEAISGHHPRHPGPAPAGRTAWSRSNKIELPCGEQPFRGQLVAIRPALARGDSATITADLPDGRREILAWIRQYDPGFPTTYWLRTPLDMPTGSRLAVVTSSAQCSITVTVRSLVARSRNPD
jgi:hypothetical protein